MARLFPPYHRASRIWSSIACCDSVPRDLDSEDVRGLNVRVETDPVVVAPPGEALVGHQIVDRVRLFAANTPLVDWHIQPAGLRPERIDVDHAQNHVAAVRGGLAVDQQLVVVAAEKAQIVVEVEGRIVTADAV